MSAHRPSGLRDEAQPPRRGSSARGRRRPHSGSHRWLTLILGVAVVAIVATAGQSVINNSRKPDDQRDRRITFAAGLPKDTPELGLVYGGLKQAEKGSLCAGAYEVVTPQTCTHGPDTVPPGLQVGADVAPVTAPDAEPSTPTRELSGVPSDAEIARDEGGNSSIPGSPALVSDAAPGQATFIMGRHDVACEGDGRSGKRIQVLYLHEFGTPSRYTQYVGSIRAWSAGADKIIDASAGETRGSRHVRFVTTPQCRVDVAEVQVPEGSLSSLAANIVALQKLGYNRTDRKYLVFADAHRYCGIGTYIADRRSGPGNRNNGGPSYGRVDSGCWSSAVATHQLVHTLGAVLPGSPNSNGAGQCTDEYDLLCAPSEAGTAAAAKPVRRVCPDKHEQRLDCNHDDYFHTDPKPGSYLAKNWNAAQSEFLLRGDGGDELPAGVPGRPANPDPAKVQAVIEARDATSTSVRLTWTAAAAQATYEVQVDDVTIATTTSTRARLIGLRPDTKYTVTVRAAAKDYLAKASVQTLPAARPAQNSWFLMTNSLTGGAADLYAGRTANGTPVVLNGAEGGAQQQWKLVPVKDGSFVLRSQATDKCVAPQDGNPVAGAPLVQVDCTNEGSQRWLVVYTDHGFSLVTAQRRGSPTSSPPANSTTVGGLVMGVGSQRFGASRLLVLQEPNQSRHQSWTALPG